VDQGPGVENEPDQDTLELQNVINDSAQKLDINTLPPKIDTKITDKQVNGIIRSLAEANQIGPLRALHLVYLLFLKGAANKGAPDSLGATIIVQGDKVEMKKGDLMSAYKTHCKNNHLRRLAEYLATPISNFASANNLPGDLFPQVFSLLTRDEEPLSIEERAWCSSFNQKNNDCLTLHPRVASLLSVEYRLKFQKNNKPSGNQNQNKGKGAGKQPAKRKGGSRPKGKNNPK
jgi:hypothetical protein